EARAPRSSTAEGKRASTPQRRSRNASTMTAYAQTNIQLYNQLAELGYTADDVRRVHRAYGLAMQLFTGSYRGSGRPFLSHLVGTASVLASVPAPIEVVTAGPLSFADSSGGVRNHLRGAPHADGAPPGGA